MTTVTLKGIRVTTVKDNDDAKDSPRPCQDCVFYQAPACPTATEEYTVGLDSCSEGGHYYVEVPE